MHEHGISVIFVGKNGAVCGVLPTLTAVRLEESKLPVCGFVTFTPTPGCTVVWICCWRKKKAAAVLSLRIFVSREASKLRVDIGSLVGSAVLV